MRWIVESSIKSRLLVIALAAGLLTLGVVQFGDTPIEALPDFGPVRVEVQTEAIGLSPEEVENLITNPLEQEFFNGIPWLHKLRSDSLSGLASIELVFEPGTHPIRARQVVQERLTMVPALPQVSQRPIVINPVATTGRLMFIGLSSKTASLIDVSVVARWKIRQRLLSVPGVSNVTMWGVRDRQLQVLVDMERLRRNDVPLQSIIRTAGNAMWSSPLTYVEASTPGIGGFIDTANQRIEIQHIQPIKGAKELGRVTIEGQERRAVTLGQVADVVENHQPLIGDAIIKDKPGVLLVVERSPEASILQVTKAVEEALDAMRPGLPGIEIDTTIFRAASFINLARENLAGALGAGVALLALLLLVYLQSWRAAFIGAAAIAVSLAAAWVVLLALGHTVNMMIVAGLVMALAVLVDDGIVDIENIKRRLRQRGAGSDSALDTIVAASVEVRGPILTALAIVIVSIAPVLVLWELSGALVRPIVFSYALAVAVSMVVALTLTPAVAVMLLSRERPGSAEPLLSAGLASGYLALLGGLVRRPLALVVVAALITLGGLAAVSKLGGARLAPALQDRELLVRLEGTPGASLPAMTRIAAAASKELRSLPGVRNVGGHIGRASNSDKVISVDGADLWVSVDSRADYAATVGAIQRMFGEGYPGLRAIVTTYPEMRIREVTEGTDQDLVVRVYGRKYDVLRERAGQVAKAISDVAGVVDAQVRLPAVEPTVEVEVLVDKASAHGLKPGEVRRAAATMISGITAGTLFEEQKIFDVVVWGKPEKRGSLTDVRQLLVDTPKGSQVRLEEVADVSIRPNPSVIKHDAVARYVDVTANVRGRSVDAVTGDVRAKLQGMTFPIEHHVEVLGEAVERRTTQRYLLTYAVCGLIAVFFLLQACFSSWRLATLVFILLPVPLAGAALAASLLPAAPSILSLLGGLAVLAVAARGGILLIRHYQRLQREEGEAFGPDLVLRGARQRFGASLLGTLAAVVVLLPLLVYGSVSGLEIVSPLAALVLGGLLVAALVNLFVLPALYLRFGQETRSMVSGA